jgi:hypothetical protein
MHLCYIGQARAGELFHPHLNARAALFLHASEAPPPPAPLSATLTSSSSSTPAAVLHRAPHGPQRGSRTTPSPAPWSSTPPCHHPCRRPTPDAHVFLDTTQRRPCHAGALVFLDTARAPPPPAPSSARLHRPCPRPRLHLPTPAMNRGP